MKVNYEEVAVALQHYNLTILNDEEIKEQIINGILEIYNEHKNPFSMSNELIILFNEFNFQLDKKTARKIVSDISGQLCLTEFFKEFSEYECLKDKLSFDRENYLVTLKVHDGFIVKSELATQKTYINDKFYYAVEEQDLPETYKDFVLGNLIIYVLYKRKRLLSYFGLSHYPYLKVLSSVLCDKKQIEKLKRNKKVGMIFTNKEVLYKSENGDKND